MASATSSQRGRCGSGNFGGIHGGTSGNEVALVAVKVVVNMEALGMVIMDIVMMETILEVRENAMILSTTTIKLHILNPGNKGNFGGRSPNP